MSYVSAPRALKTVCARALDRALLGGPSTSPLAIMDAQCQGVTLSWCFAQS